MSYPQRESYQLTSFVLKNKLKLMLETLKTFALDTLFPVFCLSCGSPDEWLCQTCFKKIETLSLQVCPYCEKNETPAGVVCRRCKANRLERKEDVPLDNLIVATKYSQANLSRLVHTFKYNFVPSLGEPLSKIILSALLDNHLALPDFILGVPLHPRRLRWRGFNQAEILAENLSRNLSPGLPIPILSDLVIRRIFTPPQMKIKNYSARKKNVKNSFTLKETSSLEKIPLRNKKILLVDDISTTGSTIMECAKIIKLAGAKSVYGAVIARQEMK